MMQPRIDNLFRRRASWNRRRSDCVMKGLRDRWQPRHWRGAQPLPQIAQGCGMSAKSLHRSRIWSYGITADDPKMVPVAAKKCFEVIEACRVTGQRGARSDDTQLTRIWSQPQTVKQDTDQVSHFCSRGAPIGMKLVHDKMKQPGLVTRQPLPGRIENRCLHAAHEHDVHHRVVCYKDVGRLILHVPARPHLAAVHAWKESGCR